MQIFIELQKKTFKEVKRNWVESYFKSIERS